MTNNKFTRREFLKLSGVTMLSVPFINRIQSAPRLSMPLLTDFPAGKLGRGVELYAKIRALPDIDSTEVGEIKEDQIVEIYREVVGSHPLAKNQRWFETNVGYIWSPLLQEVGNHLNEPSTTLNQTSIGEGMWVEVTVPYVEVELANDKPIGPRIKFLLENSRSPRLYYKQVLWVDQTQTDENGQVWYRLGEPYGSYGDQFWGQAEAFRPIPIEETTPINPDVENKHIEINLANQTLSCFEDNREVYFCLISSGRLGQETPIGENYRVYWKLISVHMAAGSAGAGYDLTGIGWPTFFATNGIAIHSTFWHNNYGYPTSAGCVNAKPADAKFVSRWTAPHVPYDTGMIDIGSLGIPSTYVKVVEY